MITIYKSYVNRIHRVNMYLETKSNILEIVSKMFIAKAQLCQRFVFNLPQK